MGMKEDQRTWTSKIIKESGSEIQVWLNTREDLIIEVKNIKSFNEQRRIFVFLKTMLQIYLSYILKPKTSPQRRLFEKEDAYVKQIYGEEEKEEGEEEGKEEEERVPLSDGDSDISEELFLLEQLEKGFGDDVDFSNIEGGSSSDEIYETKSYYLKRLKEYDQELF